MPISINFHCGTNTVFKVIGYGPVGQTFGRCVARCIWDRRIKRSVQGMVEIVDFDVGNVGRIWHKP